MIKVMIVDDSRIFRKMLRPTFVETGNEVIGEAGNGQEALELLKSCQPDLVTLDITNLSSILSFTAHNIHNM